MTRRLRDLGFLFTLVAIVARVALSLIALSLFLYQFTTAAG